MDVNLQLWQRLLDKYYSLACNDSIQAAKYIGFGIQVLVILESRWPIPFMFIGESHCVCIST